MKYVTLIIFVLFLPFFAFADTYTGVAGAAQAMGDFFTDIWSFLDDDVPSFFERALAFFIEKLTLLRIAAQLEAIKLSWSVAKVVMENYQIASKVLSAANSLPRDVKAALLDMRFFDGLNIITQAFLARYVMRFL
ncbi:DUF2523 family protein [Pseudoalteromonas sp. MMG012]|uniref:DUF2523 family protein n=1 Tax=Pseudoalteromonas sp. MMG012 TaxID=2822686 RepID=UPI001B39DF0F|nr:DUF2523 family protein [Pseudoalteromonas sp. MMG012]MBQ4852835.1 DUF2523 domain-containing protein [Pseudoalteromonas sp. MMG012]